MDLRSKDPFVGELATSTMQRLTLAPGQQASIGVFGASTRRILRDATNEDVAYVHFQVGVQKVEFNDGTTWSSPKSAGEFFSPELAARAGKSHCDNGRPR